ncbi:MAG: hypothetical protein LBQ27_00065 [Clostridiales bacterium]|nr:hypothetical protein [Clostridiales bacterium]
MSEYFRGPHFNHDGIKLNYGIIQESRSGTPDNAVIRRFAVDFPLHIRLGGERPFYNEDPRAFSDAPRRDFGRGFGNNERDFERGFATTEGGFRRGCNNAPRRPTSVERQNIINTERGSFREEQRDPGCGAVRCNFCGRIIGREPEACAPFSCKNIRHQADTSFLLLIDDDTHISPRCR